MFRIILNRRINLGTLSDTSCCSRRRKIRIKQTTDQSDLSVLQTLLTLLTVKEFLKSAP